MQRCYAAAKSAKGFPVPRRTDPLVELYLAELVRDHPDWGAPRLEEAVSLRFPPEPDGRTAISRSKIGMLLPKLRDGSGRWRLEPGEPDPAFIVRVLASSLSGRLTRRQAEWIRTIHAAVPELEPLEVLRLADLYRTCEALGLDEVRHRMDGVLGDPAGVNVALLAGMAERLMTQDDTR